MSVGKVLIVGQGMPIQERARRLARCSTCESVHKGGQCKETGSFIISVSDEDCPKTKNNDLEV